MSTPKNKAPDDIGDLSEWQVIGLVVADVENVDGDLVMLHEFGLIGDPLAVADIMKDVAGVAQKHYDRAVQNLQDEPL
jgi:hypothetical protein